jgi:1,4-alpha-glucan branching enzyme
MSRDGRLALVLHTHMPYVEGFGTWPFGEEWLWEAVATSYLPLLDVLDPRVTLSVTPVLADGLLAPGAHERLLAFCEELRPVTHARDAEALRAGGEPALAAEIERAAGDYARAAARLREQGPGGLARELLARAAWTSAATHAVLPLLATDAGVRLQLGAGIAAHRERAGSWDGGLWLPECAHAPWIDPLLEEAGVRATCVDLTDVLGRGDVRHLAPLATVDGPLLVPVDRATIELVWHDAGYPSAGAYRDYHRYTEHRHRAWAVDGTPYDHDRALEQAARDARDFVARVARRVHGGGLCTVALDTELLGHWWYEGPSWLAAVVAECDRQGVGLVALDDALEDAVPAGVAAGLPVTTWGTPRDLSTWSGRAASWFAWTARDAELRVLAALDADARAVRELLAVQASDWAFLHTRELAGDYPRRRVEGHLAGLDAALAAPGQLDPAVRGLAPFAELALLRTP